MKVSTLYWAVGLLILPDFSTARAIITKRSPTTDVMLDLDDRYVDSWQNAYLAYESMKTDDIGLSSGNQEAIERILGLVTEDGNPVLQELDHLLEKLPYNLRGPVRAWILNQGGLLESRSVGWLRRRSWKMIIDEEEMQKLRNTVERVEERLDQKDQADREEEQRDRMEEQRHRKEEEKERQRHKVEEEKWRLRYEAMERELDEVMQFAQPNCGLPELTLDSWNSTDASQILVNEISNWHYLGKPMRHFVDYLFKTYAPGVSKVDRICNGRGQCGMGHCRHLSLKTIHQKKRAPMFYIFEGIAKLNREYAEYHGAIAEAVDSTMADVNHVYVAHTPKILQEKRSDKSGAAETPWLNMIFGNLVPVVCDIFSPGVGAAYGLAKDAAINKNDQSVRARQDAIVANLGLNQPLGAIMIPLEQFSTNLRENFEKVRDKVHDDAEQLFESLDADEHGHSTLAKLLEDGAWIDRRLDNDHFRERRESLKQRWEASNINVAWRSNYGGFSQSKAKGGSCKGDDRGHPSVKVCMEDLAPGEVFYASFLNWEKGHGGHDWFEALPGFSKMRFGLKLEEMARASFMYKQRFGTKDFLDLDPEDLAEFSRQGGLAGVVNLPFWRCPDGHCIPRLGNPHKLNVPCFAGDFQWDEISYKKAKDGGLDETHETARAFGLMNHPSWAHECMNKHKTWCKAIDLDDGSRDLVWAADANKYVKAAKWTFDNNARQWVKHSSREFRNGHLEGVKQRYDDLHSGHAMHVPGWRTCDKWQPHRWGVIEEVDGEIDTERWRRWNKNEGNKERGFDNAFPHPHKGLDDKEWGIKATGGTPGKYADNGTRIYLDMTELMDDRPDLLDDMTFLWKDWRTSATNRGILTGHEDDEDTGPMSQVKSPGSGLDVSAIAGPSVDELELPTAVISIVDVPPPTRTSTAVRPALSLLGS